VAREHLRLSTFITREDAPMRCCAMLRRRDVRAWGLLARQEDLPSSEARTASERHDD